MILGLMSLPLKITVQIFYLLFFLKFKFKAYKKDPTQNKRWRNRNQGPRMGFLGRLLGLKQRLPGPLSQTISIPFH